MTAEDAKSLHGPLGRHKTICGKIDMRIARDGKWFYHGTPIPRKEMVCLFASLSIEAVGRAGGTRADALQRGVAFAVGALRIDSDNGDDDHDTHHHPGEQGDQTGHNARGDTQRDHN